MDAMIQASAFDSLDRQRAAQLDPQGLGSTRDG
jgi:hypothetical protein